MSDEAAGLYRHRYREARRAGMVYIDAALFASSDADVGMMRRLARDGCSPDLILRILL
jgi:hypothetical protein